MLVEKKRPEDMAVAGRSDGKAESVFLCHARFKIRPQMRLWEIFAFIERF